MNKCEYFEKNYGFFWLRCNLEDKHEGEHFLVTSSEKECLAFVAKEFEENRKMLFPDNDPVIHILNNGFPLCRFSLDIPASWSLGHRWISLNSSAEATCTNCIKQKEIIQNA